MSDSADNSDWDAVSYLTLPLYHDRKNPSEDKAMMALDRRQFLFAGAQTLLSFGMGQSSEARAEEPAKGAPQHGKLRALPAGAALPSGWLEMQLRKQASQLAFSLPDVSEPFTGSYWEGEERYQAELKDGDASWWAWEQKAYWTDGALRCALLLNDRRLFDRAIAPVRYTLSHMGADRYLGPNSCKSPEGDFHRWPHTVFFRALQAASDTGDAPGAVEAVRRHYLADTASYAVPKRNVTNIESMLWAYGKTGDTRLLQLAESAWHGYLALPPDVERGDLGAAKVLGDLPVNSHGVTYAETSKLPAILYLYTGKREYLDFALAAQKRVTERYMLVDGVPSTSEYYQSITSRDVHETCDIADHTWSWGYLLMATGDATWADRIERACLNAGFGAVRKDWKGVQYLSCPNQMIATSTSSHIPNSGRDTMSYQPNPGRRVACCAGNVHRILPNYASRMWMTNEHGGPAATLFGPCTAIFTVGRGRETVHIVEETNYPFEETVQFTIDSQKPVEFPFSFRVPGWCDAPQLSVNGKPYPLHAATNGFVSIKRTFAPGDRITLTLPMKVGFTEWPDGGLAVEHGPLVYSLPITEKWTSTVEERWSTREFPSWNAEPSTPWNYALAARAGGGPKAEDEVNVHRHKVTGDPWTNVPVRLSLQARRVHGWELAADAKDSSIRFSPPLPSVGMAGKTGASVASAVPVRDFLPEGLAPVHATLGEVETIELVPYGSTHLRVTVFPTFPVDS